VGPDYKRPPVTVPEAYRGAQALAGASIAEQDWKTMFEDESLRALIVAGLTDNIDVRIAAVRILQADAVYGVTRSQQFPTVDGEATVQGQRGATPAGFVLPATGFGQFNVSAAWEVDFWGKFRRATEGARADPRDRMGTTGSRDEADLRARNPLLQLARAGPATRDRAADAHDAPRFAASCDRASH